LIIESIPGALPYKNEGGQLPIQSAVWEMDTINIFPFKVGGRGMRGGLLVADPIDDYHLNTLQLIVNISDKEHPISCDTSYLEVMTDLRRDSLFLKEYIKNHNLLYHSCNPESSKVC
jgi:hypothetical protein